MSGRASRRAALQLLVKTTNDGWAAGVSRKWEHQQWRKNECLFCTVREGVKGKSTEALAPIELFKEIEPAN